MKLYGYIYILLTLTFTSIYTIDEGMGSTSILHEYTNRTNMFIRPVYDAISIEQASWHDIVYNKQKKHFAAQITGIYAQTYPNLDTSSYFLFDHKNRINVSAADTSMFQTTGSQKFQAVVNPRSNQMYVPSPTRDVLGQWLSLTTEKDLTFSLNPSNRQVCMLFEASQDLKQFFHSSLFENWFINVSAPLTWIENNIGFFGDRKALDAFNQPDFMYVNFSNCDLSSFRLSQATFSLGTKYMSKNHIQVIMSSGVIVPLVEQPSNEFILEPVQGYNAHFGFDTKIHFQFPIIEKTPDTSSITMFIDLHNNFLTRNHQLRTYDIKGKPFSRYMKLLDSWTNSLVPAMNALTIRSRVEPFNIVTFATGFRVCHNHCFGEIGYELWAHGCEVITPQPKANQKLGSWNDDRYGIAFINADGVLGTINATTGAVEALPSNELGQTASKSTINYVSGPDGKINCCNTTPEFIQKNVYLTLKDLDRRVPAVASAITHKAFMSAGFGRAGKNIDSFVNFGAYIEASQNNAALCFWGGWFKAGCTF